MKQKKYTKMRINWPGITWIILVVAAVIFFLILNSFIIFPKKYKLPVALILMLIVLIMGYFSLKKRKNTKYPKKNVKRILTTIINCILSIVMIIANFYIPALQAKMKGLFVEPSTTQEIRINAYVMTSAYKSAHTDVFTQTNTSEDLDDYKNSKFLIQNKIDQDNQAYALNDIMSQMNVSTLNMNTKDDVISAIGSLYSNEGDVMILNESFATSIAEVPGYENFSTDTQILYTVTRTVEVETPKVESTKNITNSSFMVFIAGSDSRDTELTQYTRTDVDMIMTVDPVNHQLLLISMPRDWYVKNPALWNGYDKLTHLGNNGMQNSIDGLNQEFEFDYITDYFEVNFVTFKNIVNAVGGIDIYNPEGFSDEEGGYFDAGNLHLDGDEALTYVRERHTLSNGDYGRNEHQAIVIQGIISKLTSKAVLGDINSLLENLQGNFLTSISSDSIYSLAEAQLNDGAKWNMISYHLGGVGDYNTTASMGSMELYVSYPIAEQITFAKEQMTKVMNGEIITQAELPSDDETTYLPN